MKIIITGDILRPETINIAHQRYNIDWIWKEFQKIFKLPILIGIDNPFNVKFEDWIKTDNPTFYKAYHLEKIDKLGLDYKDIIIIGFELPNNLLVQIKNYNIYYLDFNIYPIRFLKDRILGIKTNLNIPNKYIVSELDFIEGAKKITPAKLTNFYNLVIGQTRIDRSLIHNGKLISLLDYSNYIKTLVPFIYKPHPLDKHYLIDEMMKFGAILSEESTYSLLASDKIKEIIGISSSVLYEAKYFNKKTTFLCERVEHRDFIPIYEKLFFTKQFFDSILN